VARLQPKSRTVELMVRKSLDPKVAAQTVARAHRTFVAEAEAQNRRVLGAVPPSETWVDGRKGAALESVNLAAGAIVTKFETFGEVLEYIDALLILHSPVLTGTYAKSHRLLADGVEVSGWETAGAAKEFLFISPLPYARKIERGESDQAPDGVYEGVAALAKNRFGNLVNIRFTFESIDSAASRLTGAAKRAAQRDSRLPAIKVTLR
jgi:hypothetical protein